MACGGLGEAHLLQVDMLHNLALSRRELVEDQRQLFFVILLPGFSGADPFEGRVIVGFPLFQAATFA
jgi:hypothetical protein